MDRREICEKIKDIINTTFKGEVDTSVITEETDLINELGVTSIEGIEILVRTESEFEIEIDDDDLTVDLLKTVATLAGYVEERLG